MPGKPTELVRKDYFWCPTCQAAIHKSHVTTERSEDFFSGAVLEGARCPRGHDGLEPLAEPTPPAPAPAGGA